MKENNSKSSEKIIFKWFWKCPKWLKKKSLKNKKYETKQIHIGQNYMEILLKSIINFGNENNNIKLWEVC